eukprot:COSAG05_NODE_8214_length_726_cov_0.904306_1_plen_147_part_10
MWTLTNTMLWCGCVWQELHLAAAVQQNNAGVLSADLHRVHRRYFEYDKVQYTWEDDLRQRLLNNPDPTNDPAKAQREVALELRLDMDFDSVADGPERLAFEKDFIADTAKLLGCDPGMLVIDELVRGSVIVKFTLRAPAAASNGAEG